MPYILLSISSNRSRMGVRSTGVLVAGMGTGAALGVRSVTTTAAATPETNPTRTVKGIRARCCGLLDGRASDILPLRAGCQHAKADGSSVVPPAGD